MKLINICDIVNTRTSEIRNYISTENMLPNKGGVCEAANVPSGTVIEYKVGDILISNIRPYFQKIWRADRNGGCSADVLCIRAKENVDSKYLYYLLSQQAFFDYVMSGAKGCKMPRGDKKQIMQWPVTLPPLEEQQRIAGILGSLDDKIELNRRLNANLEAQAQALFRSWFVDFEPFGDGPFVDSELGKIPQGWKVGAASEFYKNITIGKTPPRKEHQWFSKESHDIVWVSIADMGNCGLSICNSSEYLTPEAIKKFNICIVPVNTVLLSFKLTIGRVAIADKELATNEAISHFQTQHNKLEYNYLALKK